MKAQEWRGPPPCSPHGLTGTGVTKKTKGQSCPP